MADKNERCVLCLEQKRSPVRIKCGHSFCKKCLDVFKSYHKYAWASRCPICRGSLKDKGCSTKQTNSTFAELANSTSSSATAVIEEIYLLEEYMAIAADMEVTSEEGDDDDDDDENEFYSEDDQEDYYFEDDEEDNDNDDTMDVDEYDEPEHSDGDVVLVDEVIIVD